MRLTVEDVGLEAFLRNREWEGGEGGGRGSGKSQQLAGEIELC